MQELEASEIEEVAGGYIYKPNVYNPLSDPHWMERNDIDFMRDPLNR